MSRALTSAEALGRWSEQPLRTVCRTAASSYCRSRLRRLKSAPQAAGLVQGVSRSALGGVQGRNGRRLDDSATDIPRQLGAPKGDTLGQLEADLLSQAGLEGVSACREVLREQGFDGVSASWKFLVDLVENEGTGEFHSAGRDAFAQAVSDSKEVVMSGFGREMGSPAFGSEAVAALGAEWGVFEHR